MRFSRISSDFLMVLMAYRLPVFFFLARNTVEKPPFPIILMGVKEVMDVRGTSMQE